MVKIETLYKYARVSTLEQVEKDLSLPRQKELGIQKATELGMAYKILNGNLHSFKNIIMP